VILPDANLLLYAIDEQSPHHAAAKRWFEGTMSGPETVGLAWATLLAFVRLSTRAYVFQSPLSVSQAFDLVDSWLVQPPTMILHPSERHAELLRELLQAVGTAGNLVQDAHLAALAIEHGAVLATADRDFERFPRVGVVYPLSS
jgi:toxin-antitoxin system PIN domain toxin